MEATARTYDKISECGKYGFLSHGTHTEGGSLWLINSDEMRAWLISEGMNPDDININDDVWSVEEMDRAIDDHEEDMAYLMAGIEAEFA
jgi:hypothetical protein|tara:strand:- start:848 stop:1114 length:267 start_codon:yes stop_codon:yes gene_type:complete